MSSFMHQSCQGCNSTPNGGWIGQGCKICFGWYEFSILRANPCGYWPMAESITIFVFAVEEIECHRRVVVLDSECSVGSDVTFDRFGEGEVWVLYDIVMSYEFESWYIAVSYNVALASKIVVNRTLILKTYHFFNHRSRHHVPCIPRLQ